MQRERAAAVSLLRVITPRRRPSMTATTRRFDPIALENMVYLSFELGEGSWTLSFTSGFGALVHRRRVPARGGAGRLLAAPLPRGPRNREPRGGLFEHRGEPPESAREDGPTRRRVAAGSPAAPPGREPEEGL